MRNIALACCIAAVVTTLFSSTSNNKKVTVAAAVQETEDTTQEVITIENEIQVEEPTESEPEKPKNVIPILESVPLEAELQTWIYVYCSAEGISPYLVYALIEKESRYNPTDIADTASEYSVGLMQINKKWHTDRMARLGITDLTNPLQNVVVGVDYLLELFHWREDTTLEWVLMAYNGGPGYADGKTAKGIVTDYANHIIKRSAELQKEGERYEEKILEHLQ